MGNDFSFSELVRIVQKRFKFIAGLGVLAAILSIVFSGETFIKPRYKSTAIVYPSNISEYSEESLSEQLQQMLESSDIRDSIIKKFDLYKDYDIEANAASARFYVINEYNSRFQIKKTKYESVEISVEDESPEQAFEMSKELLRLVDLKIRGLHRAKFLEVVKMSENQLKDQKLFLDSIEGRLNQLRGEGILEYEMQTQEATRGLYRLAAAGKSGSREYAEAKKTLDNLAKNGGEFKRLYEEVEQGNEHYAEIMEKYSNALSDSKKELTYVNTVVAPEKADKKHYPVRWLIVFTAVFSSVLFSIVIFLFTDKSKVGASEA